MTNLRLTLPLPPSGQEPRPLPLHAEPMGEEGVMNVDAPPC